MNWKSIKAWWKRIHGNFRYLIHLDIRALDDPAWLTGQTPRKETQKMLEDAKKQAGLASKK